jgi:hypothetical protein
MDNFFDDGWVYVIDSNGSTALTEHSTITRENAMHVVCFIRVLVPYLATGLQGWACYDAARF